MRPEIEAMRNQFYLTYGMILFVLFIVLGLILARTHAKNNALPVLTVPVRLIKKKKASPIVLIIVSACLGMLVYGI